MYVGDYWHPSRGLQANHCRATDEYGDKHVLGIMDGFRENADSWRDLLRGLKKRGLSIAPDLAIGDGALGFWTALRDVYPTTREQRCCPLGDASIACLVTGAQDGQRSGGHAQAASGKSQGWFAGYPPLGHVNMPCRARGKPRQKLMPSRRSTSSWKHTASNTNARSRS